MQLRLMIVEDMLKNEFVDKTTELLKTKEAQAGLSTPLTYDILQKWVKTFVTEPGVT